MRYPAFNGFDSVCETIAATLSKTRAQCKSYQLIRIGEDVYGVVCVFGVVCVCRGGAQNCV